MSIILKSSRELARMQRACELVVDILGQLARMAAPGVTTAELDELASGLTERAGAQPLFKGVPNPHGKAAFPASICASRNNVLVHGIPDEKPLLDGDILSIDFGVRLDGYCGDAATTLMIGNVSPQAKDLVETTRNVLKLAVENCHPNRRWFEVAEIIDSFVRQAGLLFGVQGEESLRISRGQFSYRLGACVANAGKAGADVDHVGRLVGLHLANRLGRQVRRIGLNQQ